MGGKNILFTSGKQGEKNVLQIAEAEALLTHGTQHICYSTNIRRQMTQKTHSHSAKMIWPTICDA